MSNAIGLKLPFRLGNDGYFETNKDSLSQVKDNIKNLLCTKPGERRFNNDFKSSLYDVLFENIITESVDFDLLSEIVQKDIDKILNGVDVQRVDLKIPDNISNSAPQLIYITVICKYNNVVFDVTTEVRL